MLTWALDLTPSGSMSEIVISGWHARSHSNYHNQFT